MRRRQLKWWGGRELEMKSNARNPMSGAPAKAPGLGVESEFWRGISREKSAKAEGGKDVSFEIRAGARRTVAVLYSVRWAALGSRRLGLRPIYMAKR